MASAVEPCFFATRSMCFVEPFGDPHLRKVKKIMEKAEVVEKLAA